MKIQDWCCHGLRASSRSHRHTVLGEMATQIPAVTAWRANSGPLHRDSGASCSAGG